MGSILNFVELLAMAVWTGSIVFFSFFTAPALFRLLEEADGRKTVRALLPRYYLFGVLCGAMLTAVQVGRGLLWYWGGMIRPAIVLFSILTLISLYSWLRFDAIHRRSVMLNSFVLLLLLLYLVWMSQRGY